MNTGTSIAIYAPLRLSEDDFLASFVAREELFDFLLDQLKNTSATANVEHRLILGQRGMGKTSLLRRIAIGIKRDADLASRYIPLTFREEQYNVRSLDRFWRNCGEALAEWCEQTGRDERAARIDRELLGPLWCQSATAADLFLKECKALGGRPVLLVDNLDLILDALPDNDHWSLRRTLQASGGPVLFGAATQHIRQSGDRKSAFYEFFHPKLLQPLTEAELLQCMYRLADTRGEAGKPVREIIAREPGRLRTLHILTGGNPRVLALVYQLMERSESDTAFSDLEILLDQLTPFYKARVEEYQTDQQRAIIDAIALHWDPITSHKLSRATAIEVTTISSQLARLKNDGLVEEVATSGARAGYQLIERFFNIWYLMRHGTRRTRQKMYWLTAFLKSFYAPDELRRMREEVDFASRKEWHPLYWEALAAALDGPLVAAPALTPFQTESLPIEDDSARPNRDRANLLEAGLSESQALFERASELEKKGRAEEAITIYDRVIAQFGAADELGLREQIVRAFFNKGFALGQLRRSEEAIAVYNDFVKRFGAAQEPRLRAAVVRALVNKGGAVNGLGRSEEAIAIFDQVIAQFGGAEESDLGEGVTAALINKGTALRKLRRNQEAIAVYDNVIARLGVADELVPHAWVIITLVSKGEVLRELGRNEEAIAICDDVVARFGAAKDSVTWQWLARALLEKGQAVRELGRNDEAIAVYDDLVARFGAAAESGLRERVASALVNKGAVAGELGRFDESIAISDDVVARFGASRELYLTERVAAALVSKGLALGRLARNGEAIEVYDDILMRFGAGGAAVFQQWIFIALMGKGIALGELGRNEEAMTAYQEVLARVEATQEPNSHKWGIMALMNKGFTLGKLGRDEEAIAAYDGTTRFDAADQQGLQDPIAAMLVGKGNALGRLGRNEEAIAVFDDVAMRFGETEEPGLRQKVAAALVNKGLALGELGRSQEAIAVYCDIVARFEAVEEKELREHVAAALISKGQALASLGDFNESIVAYRHAIRLRFDSWNAWMSLGNVLADHLGDSAEAEMAYREAIRHSGTNQMPRGNLIWLQISLERLEEARALRHVLSDIDTIGLALIDCALAIGADNLGSALKHLDAALRSDEAKLASTYFDDFLRLLRLFRARGFGERLIAWFEETGHADRRAPVFAALVAFIRGERFLRDVNPEVRSPAEKVLRWLTSQREAQVAESSAAKPKRHRGRSTTRRTRSSN